MIFCEAIKTSLATKIVRRFQRPPVVVSDVLKPPGWRHCSVPVGQRNLQPHFWKHSRIFTYQADVLRRQFNSRLRRALVQLVALGEERTPRERNLRAAFGPTTHMR